ncbi:hypothetical protein HPB52_012481 [Rhipicephalus sanguineus]|uniref:Uncharacterized protein n=1 Tax=Rhipicephalus sanguineus TaxID=34632 RepID=A0A9D4T081_RHISA|nr:hypothetical protein HPB52_012481 [Rhipicephalus sanguineus]
MIAKILFVTLLASTCAAYQRKLEVQDSDGHDIQFPHLLYTSNSSQIQLSLLNLSPQLGKTSQFGFELTILDDSSRNNTYGISSARTFDDEYTPGVFTHGSHTEHLTVASSAITVAFGSEGDGWYQENNYATWAMSSGFGERPLEHVSATVLSVTSVGLGIPAIIALGTVIYVSVHKPEPKL